MLVLSRERDETIMIGDDIEITIVDIRGDKIRIGINAPAKVAVHRKEVYDAIRAENAQAARLGDDELNRIAATIEPGPARQRLRALRIGTGTGDATPGGARDPASTSIASSGPSAGPSAELSSGLIAASGASHAHTSNSTPIATAGRGLGAVRVTLAKPSGGPMGRRGPGAAVGAEPAPESAPRSGTPPAGIGKRFAEDRERRGRSR